MNNETKEMYEKKINDLFVENFELKKEMLEMKKELLKAIRILTSLTTLQSLIKLDK